MGAGRAAGVRARGWGGGGGGRERRVGRGRSVGRDLERLAFAAPAPLRAWVHPAVPGRSAAAWVTSSQPSFRLDRERVHAARIPLPQGWEAGTGASVGTPAPQELPEGALFVPLSSDAYVLGRPAGSRDGKKGPVTPTDAVAPTVWEGWEGGRLAWEFETSAHGKLVPGGWFSRGAAFCPQSRRIAFVADCLPSRKRPRFQAPPAGSSGGDAAAEGGQEGWEGRGFLEQDWGEQHSGRPPPAVWVLDLERQEIARVPTEDPKAPSLAGASAGQPTWLPDGSLVFTVWIHSARENGSCFAGGLDRRLGAVYCHNRPCHLARSWLGEDGSWQGPSRMSPAGLRSAHSAAVCASRDDTSPYEVVFLSHGVACDTGVHSAGASLHALSPPTDPASAPLEAAVRCVVEAVAAPRAGAADQLPFYGIYASTLLPEAGSFAPGWVVMSTLQRSKFRCMMVCLADGSVTMLGSSGSPQGDAYPSESGSEEIGSLQLLGCAEDLLVAARSQPHRTPELVWMGGEEYIEHLAANEFLCGCGPADGVSQGATSPSNLGTHPAKTVAVAWNRFTSSSEWPAEVSEVNALLESRTLAVEVHPEGGRQQGSFDAVVLRAPEGGPDGEQKSRPVLVVPHGGPHSASPFAWNASLAVLALQGYTLVMPNYRGSLGFGNEALLTLPGKVGEQDVGDCLAALDAALQAYPDLDGARVALLGGSHGGFLTAHLLGQHPSRFFAGALRNPVCSLPAMVSMTDIPDWCYVEAFGVAEGAKKAKASPSVGDLEKMYEKSPIRHVAGVTAPTLFLLGALDKRVPKDDALQYVRALEAEGNAPAPECIVFPEDCHPLNRPRTHYESWCTLVEFLHRHLPERG